MFEDGNQTCEIENLVILEFDTENELDVEKEKNGFIIVYHPSGVIWQYYTLFTLYYSQMFEMVILLILSFFIVIGANFPIL